MKVFSVYGYSKSGKTTVVEAMVRELTKRRFSVGSIKEIHYEDFKLDTPTSNTGRHRSQGANPVTARGYTETDIMYDSQLTLPQILEHYHQDFVVCEGVTESGRVAELLDDTYKGVPVINVLTNPEKLCELVLDKVFDLLPDVDEKCCFQCGYGCRGLTEKIIHGEAKRNDCIQKTSDIKLFMDGREIGIVPFVEEILRNTCLGVVSTLDGYHEGCKIEIKLQ